jgi:hypothetical protein
MKDGTGVTTNDTAKFSSDELEGADYWLYAVDSYGNVSEVVVVRILDNTGIPTINTAKLQLYPTPVEDMLYIQSDQSIHSFELFNVVGVKVMEANNPEDRINMSHLEKGMYCIRIKLNGDQVFTGKVVKK